MCMCCVYTSICNDNFKLIFKWNNFHLKHTWHENAHAIFQIFVNCNIIKNHILKEDFMKITHTKYHSYYASLLCIKIRFVIFLVIIMFTRNSLYFLTEPTHKYLYKKKREVKSIYYITQDIYISSIYLNELSQTKNDQKLL